MEPLGRDFLMVDVATAVTVVDAATKAGVPVLLWGDPGVGKTSVVRALGAGAGVPVEVVSGSQSEPVDIAGWPRPDGDVVRLLVPEWVANLSAGGYLFLEELTTCPPAVQAAMLSVTFDRVVGRVKLGDDVRIVAAANPPDRSAGGLDLTPPMANRFLYLDFEPSTDEWLAGMRSGFAGVPASRAVAADALRVADEVGVVCAFIETRPTLLQRYPDTDTAAGRAWPSRRTWDYVARVLPWLRGDDTAAVTAAVVGLIGEAAGFEFISWRAALDLPSVADVLADPTVMDWSGARPDRVWAVLSGVVSWAATKGSKEAWNRAWGPLVAAATGGAPDVAGAAARSLGAAMPPGAKPPAAARQFRDVLVAAGLMDGSAV